MLKNYLKKVVSIVLSLSFFANPPQVNAAVLVAIPKNVRPIIPPLTFSPTNRSEISFQAVETKISNVFNPEKIRPKLTETYSGTCGTNVNWHLDTSTGQLTISGSGAITSYSDKTYVPWYSHRDSIKNVVIGDGVTSIGNYAFSNCYGLTGSLSIPNSVTTIGSTAFYNCYGLDYSQ